MAENTEAPDEAKKTVLVVDDDLSFREFLKLFFSDKGFRVRTYDSPDKALNAIEEDPELDFAYIDINYAGSPVTGFELAGEMKKRWNGLRFPFVIMSMDDDPENHTRSQKSGALAFMDKKYESLEASLTYVKDILALFPEELMKKFPYRIFNARNLHS